FPSRWTPDHLKKLTAKWRGCCAHLLRTRPCEPRSSAPSSFGYLGNQTLFSIRRFARDFSLTGVGGVLHSFLARAERSDEIQHSRCRKDISNILVCVASLVQYW